MRANRSIPAAAVIPVLVYPDVREAVAWLEAAFGFVERLRIGENHRSQLNVGDGAVIVGDTGVFRVDTYPFGGTKSSGLGREGVRWAMEEMTEPRMLVLDLAPRSV